MSYLDYQKTLGANIRFEREKRGLTIANIANMLGLTITYLGLVERGCRGTSLPNIMQLSEFFEVSIDDLLLKDLRTGEDVKSREPKDNKVEKNRKALHSYANKLSPEALEAVVGMIKIQTKLINNVKKADDANEKVVENFVE
jgi:transcriptional regulator with XRE-family HTH domain